MAPADPWPGQDDDTDCGYYDKPSGDIWCPDDEPGPWQQNPALLAAAKTPGPLVAGASSGYGTQFLHRVRRTDRRVPDRGGELLTDDDGGSRITIPDYVAASSTSSRTRPRIASRSPSPTSDGPSRRSSRSGTNNRLADSKRWQGKP